MPAVSDPITAPLDAPETRVHDPEGCVRHWMLKPVAAACVLSVAGALQVTVSVVVVPSLTGATIGAAGAFGGATPVVIVDPVATVLPVPPALLATTWK